MGFSRQEYWSGLPFSSLGDLPDSGIEPRSPALQADSAFWATRKAGLCILERRSEFFRFLHESHELFYYLFFNWLFCKPLKLLLSSEPSWRHSQFLIFLDFLYNFLLTVNSFTWICPLSSIFAAVTLVPRHLINRYLLSSTSGAIW